MDVLTSQFSAGGNNMGVMEKMGSQWVHPQRHSTLNSFERITFSPARIGQSLGVSNLPLESPGR